MDVAGLKESLKITDLKYRNFRNYRDFELSDIGTLTIFVGKNAVGKTNILEGIQLLTAQSSFRNPQTPELIHWNLNSTFLRAHVSNNIRELDIEMKIGNGKRKYFLNEKPKQIQELKGTLSSVMFSPDDLDLIKGSNSVKRNEIDQIGAQISSNYYVIKRDYERILHQKNQLLKDNFSVTLLESINETLVKIGTQLFCYRYSLYKRIREIFIELYPDIVDNNEQAGVNYTPSWCELLPNEGETPDKKEEVAGIYMAALQQVQEEEIRRKRSLVGPHKDIISFTLNGKDAKTYGSQGQQRSLVLCFKLTEVRIIQEILNRQPILLLDDVMSELDEQRRNALISFISEDIQTFITTTNLHYFSDAILKKANIIELPIKEAGQ